MAWHPWKEAAASLPTWKIRLSPGLQSHWFHLMLQAPVMLSREGRAAALARGHKVQMQHKYSVRHFPALPPSGCCPCCTWKNKSLHNKTHAHPRPRHTPAGPEPSTASPTKLLEGFCPPWSNREVYLSCSQPAQADVLLQNEFPHISHPLLCSWSVQT